jgi:hypothetical protein
MRGKCFVKCISQCITAEKSNHSFNSITFLNNRGNFFPPLHLHSDLTRRQRIYLLLQLLHNITLLKGRRSDLRVLECGTGNTLPPCA